jgi:hypothetical protein
MARRVLRALAVLGLGALSAAAVNHCFEPDSVGGSCADEAHLLCFESDVSTAAAGAGSDPKKVLALMRMVGYLEDVQDKIKALEAGQQGSPSAGRRVLKAKPSKTAKAIAALTKEQNKTKSQVAKQLRLLNWDNKGECKDTDFCKQGTFLPTSDGDEFLNMQCTRDYPGQEDFGCTYDLPPPGEPARIPAIRCSEFFHGDQ